MALASGVIRRAVDCTRQAGARRLGCSDARHAGPPTKDKIMAKGQKKSSRETRKPKAEKPAKGNASNPSVKPGVVRGLDNMTNNR